MSLLLYQSNKKMRKEQIVPPKTTQMKKKKKKRESLTLQKRIPSLEEEKLSNSSKENLPQLKNNIHEDIFAWWVDSMITKHKSNSNNLSKKIKYYKEGVGVFIEKDSNIE